MSSKKKVAAPKQKEFVVVLKGESPTSDFAIWCADEADFRKQLEDSGDIYDMESAEEYDVYSLAGTVTVKPSMVVVEGWDNVIW